MSCLLVVGWRLLQGGRSVGRSVPPGVDRWKPFRFPELLTQEKQMKRASTLLNLNRYEIYFYFCQPRPRKCGFAEHRRNRYGTRWKYGATVMDGEWLIMRHIPTSLELLLLLLWRAAGNADDTFHRIRLFLSWCNTRSSRHLLTHRNQHPQSTFRLFHITKRWWRMIVVRPCVFCLILFCFFLIFYLFLRNGPFKCELKGGGGKHVRTKEMIYLFILLYPLMQSTTWHERLNAFSVLSFLNCALLPVSPVWLK